MGKVVIESHYSRFKPVRQDPRCASCPSGCKTSCVRPISVLANANGSKTTEEDQEVNK